MCFQHCVHGTISHTICMHGQWGSISAVGVGDMIAVCIECRWKVNMHDPMTPTSFLVLEMGVM